MKFLHFFLLGFIFALLDPDPDPADQNQCGPMRIRIFKTGTDSAKFCQESLTYTAHSGEMGIGGWGGWVLYLVPVWILENVNI